MSEEVIELLDKPIYGFSQIDQLLALRKGTARRWIEGYERRGKQYLPVVRPEPTGEEIATWGEFVEARFLAEFRDKGVPMLKMRPAIERLREEFQTKYPLAVARPFVSQRDLVMRVQDQVGLASRLRIVIVRSGQLTLTDAAETFWRAVDFDDPDEGSVVRLHPLSGNHDVVVDPLRQFGVPVVRSVPTEVIAEQFDAGDSVEEIAHLYELGTGQVEAALRYERERIKAQAPPAA